MALDVHPDAGRLDHVGQQVGVLAAAQHRPDAGHQLAVAERLGDVVVGAELQTDDLVDLGVPGGDHDDRHGAALAQATADLGAGQAGHHQVEQDDVGAVALELGQPLLAVGSQEDLEPLLGEHEAQGVPIALLVLDDQDHAHATSSSAGAAGRVMVKVEPLPSLLHTATSPPCPSTISATIDNPRPVPPVSRLRA